MAAMEKNNKTLNVPHLRFPEFSGEWERHSLGEIGSTLIGLTYSPADVVKEEGVIVLRSSNIQDGEIDYKDLVRVNKKIKDSLFTKKNDILICARNGSSRLIGKNALISDDDTGHSYGAFMMVYRSEDNPYVRQLLCTKRYFAQVGENLGARINQITTSDMNSFEFFFPQSKEERNKIALFLRLIDERISTQKKIIEKYESLIRGLYQFLFQQAKYDHFVSLGDISQISNGNSDVKDASMYNDGSLYPFFDRSDEIKFLPEYLFDKEAIIYPGEGAEFYPRYYNGKFALHQRCYAVYDISTDIIPRYLYHYCKTQNSYFVRNAVGSTVASLRLDTFKRLKIPAIPTHHQEALVMFLDKIEAKIECNRTILKKYEEQKKYLLFTLFI